MAAIIMGKRDNLDEIARGFELEELRHTVFLNSVPKAGTHLLRNVVRMFVPPEQQYHRDYIQIPNLAQHLAAFGTEKRWLSWGHLLFSDQSAIPLKGARHLVLVRDPHSWVLARARFFLSEEFQGPLNHIKNGAVDAEQVLNMMIFGVHQRAPSMLDIFTHNAAAWMGANVTLVRYEDILRHVNALEAPAAETYFRDLLSACGIERFPDDWRQRVRIGADRVHSRTARENLTGGVELPDVLPATQQALVEFAAPGLRRLLGYA